MKHLILGNGNLALELHTSLENQGFETLLLPFEELKNWGDASRLDFTDIGVVWSAIGGTHWHARSNKDLSFQLNVALPRYLLEHAPRDVRMVFFSTLEVAHPEMPTKPHWRTPEPQSPWASMKLALESAVVSLNRPWTSYVRLGTLYGDRRPEVTFPGRLLRSALPDDALLSIPHNEIVPTPAHWAAMMLVKSMTRNLWNPGTYTCHHLAPMGSISAFDLAKIILGTRRDRSGWLEKVTWDHTRPRRLEGGSTLDIPVEHWSNLWSIFYTPDDYQGV